MEKGKQMTKKILSILVILAFLFFTFQISSNAASIPLNSIDVTVSETKIRPGENVTVNINFGTDLGAYTFDVAYDNNIFEYVSSEGGTENDDGTRVRVTFYDSTGGTSPRTSMSVTFKAKDSIVTTNPTDFSVTGEGLANADASQEYDDITSPVKKSVTVEPDYKDYTISLNYSGNIMINEAKDMELVTKSAMGKNYDNLKLTAEVVSKPSDDATVKLIATTKTRQEVDLIQEAWGEVDGYALGGKDVEQILEIAGTFSTEGNYKIKFSILDKDSGDAEIATRTVDVTAKSQATVDEGNKDENTGDNNANGGAGNNENNNQNGNTGNSSNNGKENVTEEVPETLPKTGMTKYGAIATVLAVLGTGYVVLQNTRKKVK